MKKKILFLTIIVAIGGAWFVLANKFELMIADKGLPYLKEYKEKGLIDFDENSIKIEKYKFKIMVDNFSFDLTGHDRTRIDQVSACYNPFTDNVTIYTSGQKISTGTGELETYVLNPSESIKINRSALEGNLEKINLVLSSKKHELLSAVDGSVLSSSGDGSIHLSGVLDKGANQFTISLQANRNSVVIKEKLLEHLKKMLDNKTQTQDKQEAQMNKIIVSFIDYYYKLANLAGPVNYKTNLTASFDKKYLENIAKIVKGEMEPNALLEGFNINEEVVEFVLDGAQDNDITSNKILISFKSDKKDIKSKIDITSTNNYSQEQDAQITKFSSESFAEIFNLVKSETSPKLVPDDLTQVVKDFTDIKSMHFGARGDYKLANSDFDTELNLSLNDYKVDLSGSGRDGKTYNGTLKLSDPAALLAAKTKFTREAAIPLFEKTGLRDKKDLVKIEKINSNIEANGFEALKALSADPDLKAGDNFQAGFSFEPESFTFKVNDKPFLKILTDDRIIKFLKGLEEAEEAKEAAQKQESIIEETEDGAL